MIICHPEKLHVPSSMNVTILKPIINKEKLLYFMNIYFVVVVVLILCCFTIYYYFKKCPQKIISRWARKNQYNNKFSERKFFNVWQKIYVIVTF